MQLVMSYYYFARRKERVRKHYPIENVEKFSDFPWPGDLGRFSVLDLNLLLVCKQIYIEAFHVFYSSHRFYFSDTELLYSFLKGIGYNRRQHLSMIALDWCGPYAKEAFRLLKTCGRLKSVQFTLPCGEPPGYAAMREIRGLEQALVVERHHYEPGWNTYTFMAPADYRCRCRPGEQGKGPLDDVLELERAMMRPRLGRYAVDPNEKLDLFKGKREVLKKTEESFLFEECLSLNETAWWSSYQAERQTEWPTICPSYRRW